MLHLPVLPKHFVFIINTRSQSQLQSRQSVSTGCAAVSTSLKGKFQPRSTGGHLLFLANKMPILKFIPEYDLMAGSKFCPFFSSSFCGSSHRCWCSQNRDQRQKGAKEKGKGKRALVFQRAENQKFIHRCVSVRMKCTPSGHERIKLQMVGALCDVQGLWLTGTLEHLQVALGPFSGGINISISAGIDDSRNRRASGLYIFNLPFPSIM